ncbi:TLC domain-containing protein 5-like [Babylonia areolata]|uniref:TLC domain-containing protein 5-like n=1 Tax=Babylonia areolata TaxID=304850 RepID=UPI003FD22FC5
MLTVEGASSFHLPTVCLSLVSWSGLYLGLRRLDPQRKAEWHCRTVTALHATLITMVTGWACFVQGPWPFTDSGGVNTPLQGTATAICLGYFLFDFAWCLYFQTEGVPMLLHHSLSILGCVWTLCAGRYGTELAATICGSEVTNPLLQLRYFLKETGRYHTVLGEVVDAVFMLSFFAVRLGVGTLLLYCYFLQPTDFMGRVGAMAIYLISWMFWVSIFRYAVRKYSKKYRAWCRSQGSERQGDERPSSITKECLSTDSSDHIGSECQGDERPSSITKEGLSAVGSDRDDASSSSSSPSSFFSSNQNSSCEVVGQGACASSISQKGSSVRHRGVLRVGECSEELSVSGATPDKSLAKGVLVNG